MLDHRCSLLRRRSLFDASEMVQTCPDGSIIRAVRSPQNWFFTGSRILAPTGHCLLYHFVHLFDIDVDHHRRACRPAGGARLARVGHSPSIMTIAGQIFSNACATVPSGPGRRPNSAAPNVVLQKSISAATSRHTNIGVNNGDAVGYRFHVAHDCVSFQIKVFESLKVSCSGRAGRARSRVNNDGIPLLPGARRASNLPRSSSRLRALLHRSSSTSLQNHSLGSCAYVAK